MLFLNAILPSQIFHTIIILSTKYIDGSMMSIRQT